MKLDRPPRRLLRLVPDDFRQGQHHELSHPSCIRHSSPVLHPFGDTPESEGPAQCEHPAGRRPGRHVEADSGEVARSGYRAAVPEARPASAVLRRRPRGMAPQSPTPLDVGRLKLALELVGRPRSPAAGQVVGAVFWFGRVKPGAEPQARVRGALETGSDDCSNASRDRCRDAHTAPPPKPRSRYFSATRC